ncbi:MAG: phage tail protein [Sedimentisphaerales bacterium]|nr:phage tail protein [Sedimentisphaerales bacterium]
MKRVYIWPLIILLGAVLVSQSLVGNTQLQGQNGAAADLSTTGASSTVFRLQLEGEEIGADYTECSGLGSSDDLIESTLVTHGAVTVRQKTPGALEWHDITLKRIGPSDVSVWSWRKAMEERDSGRAVRDGMIIMFSGDPPQLIARWDFHRGWPAWLTFDGSTETLAIVHEGIERVKPEQPQPHR